LSLANITVNFQANDLRPAAAFTDIDGLEIDNFKAQRPTKIVKRTVFHNGLRTVISEVQFAEGVPAAKFDDVKRRVIRNSPVLDGIVP